MYKIQMKQDGQWWNLGGIFDAVTADERVLQFTAHFTTRGEIKREFRLKKLGGE